MSLLSVENVSKAFAGVRAVDGVSFTVDRGQVVGFLGPNGAGKSTTMRMITQYLEPDSGVVQIEGVPLDQDPIAAKRRIGYLPENNPLYTDMLVVDYLAFMAELRGLDAARARSGIEEAVEATGIQDVYYRPIDELSKGFRQRVGLAQAILHRPDLLVLDEPTEGLDPNQRVEIRRLIADLGAERTVLLSTHVLSEVQHTCSRLLVISRGRLVADGAVEELVAHVTGGSQVIVEVEGTGVIDALKKLGGVRAVTASPAKNGRTGATITTDGSVDVRPLVFGVAKEHGWTLYELHRETRSLEELFMQLTATPVDEPSSEGAQ
jgi:ABC-2 type transport system ATP-binding protein